MSDTAVTPTVFVGHPYLDHPDQARVLAIVTLLRAALAASGFEVRPESIVGVADVPAVRGPARELVASNVDGVVHSDLVVLLDDGAPSRTSMWVEAGMALSARRPTVVITSSAARLPFLVRSAAGEADGALPPWLVLTDVPITPSEAVVEVLAARIVRWAADQGIAV